MKLDKIVPYRDHWAEETADHITLRDILTLTHGLQHAGHLQIDQSLEDPGALIKNLLTENAGRYCPAMLFCGEIHTHQNGHEYVIALRPKGRTHLVAEKYWLDDPLLPSLSLAILE